MLFRTAYTNFLDDIRHPGVARLCCLATVATLICISAHAGDTRSYVGQTVKKDFAVGLCDIGSMTVKYDIVIKHRKPLVRGSYAWESAFGTPANCLDEDLVIWLQLRNGNSVGYIRLAPEVPKAGQGFSKPFVSEVDWDDLICSYKGKEKQSCFPRKIAKAMFAEGEITGFSPSQH